MSCWPSSPSYDFLVTGNIYIVLLKFAVSNTKQDCLCEEHLFKSFPFRREGQEDVQLVSTSVNISRLLSAAFNAAHSGDHGAQSVTIMLGTQRGQSWKIGHGQNARGRSCMRRGVYMKRLRLTPKSEVQNVCLNKNIYTPRAERMAFAAVGSIYNHNQCSKIIDRRRILEDTALSGNRPKISSQSQHLRQLHIMSPDRAPSATAARLPRPGYNLAAPATAAEPQSRTHGRTASSA